MARSLHTTQPMANLPEVAEVPEPGTANTTDHVFPTYHPP